MLLAKIPLPRKSPSQGYRQGKTKKGRRPRIGLPSFRRMWIVSDAPPRRSWVQDKKSRDERVWDPTNDKFWRVCHVARATEFNTATPAAGTTCRLCPGAQAAELLPCAWCGAWCHWRRTSITELLPMNWYTLRRLRRNHAPSTPIPWTCCLEGGGRWYHKPRW